MIINFEEKLGGPKVSQRAYASRDSLSFTYFTGSKVGPPVDKVKNYNLNVTEVLVSVFSNRFFDFLNFTVGILTVLPTLISIFPSLNLVLSLFSRFFHLFRYFSA